MSEMVALLLAMGSFSFAMSISPGPVNMIILSSGVNYGLEKTLPYVSGATFGFTLLLLLVGLIFEQLITAYPFFLTYLAIGGSLYIIYMGYKIATAVPTVALQQTSVPPRFYAGFVLQWLNPKAWIACVSGVSMFSNAESNEIFFIFAGIYFLVCYASLSAWAIFGDKLSA